MFPTAAPKERLIISIFYLPGWHLWHLLVAHILPTVDEKNATIKPVEVGRFLSHYLQGFRHVSWLFWISEPSTVIILFATRGVLWTLKGANRLSAGTTGTTGVTGMCFSTEKNLLFTEKSGEMLLLCNVGAFSSASDVAWSCWMFWNIYVYVYLTLYACRSSFCNLCWFGCQRFRLSIQRWKETRLRDILSNEKILIGHIVI